MKRFAIKENANHVKLKRRFDVIAKEKRLKSIVETRVFHAIKNVVRILIAQTISVKKSVILENANIASSCQLP